MALIGSNGAGKTTLIRCLLGEYTHGGDVSLVGRDPRRSRTEVLRHVGFVPQLPPPLKIISESILPNSLILCDIHQAVKCDKVVMISFARCCCPNSSSILWIKSTPNISLPVDFGGSS